MAFQLRYVIWVSLDKFKAVLFVALLSDARRKYCGKNYHKIVQRCTIPEL